MSTIAGVTMKNLAQRWTPHLPMRTPGFAPERIKVWLDIPKELEANLGSGIIIGTTCLVENAELIISMFEDMCLEHVINMQIKDKMLSKLMRGNRTVEAANPDEHVIDEPGKRIAKSSFLDQDPWGDEEIPEDPEADEEDGTYTQLQMLLKRIQDDNYMYLTTHIRRILHKDVYLNVRNEEVKYELNESNIRSNTNRNRMPWSHYKDVIYELLPEQTGLHELCIMMTINREDGESAHSWVQRLTEGRRALAENDIELSEALYTQIALKYMTYKERTLLTDKVGNAGLRSRSTKQKLLRKMRDLSLDKIVQIVGTTLNLSQEYRLAPHKRTRKQMVYTKTQAMKLLNSGHKPQAKRVTKKENAESGKPKAKVQCEKCVKAGLRGKRAAHKTEDCVDAVREKAVRKMKEYQRKKASDNKPTKRPRSEGRKPGNQKRVSPADFECINCKNAGRKYRHDPAKCKFAPGGEWHGKSPEELRSLQKAFYQKINQSR